MVIGGEQHCDGFDGIRAFRTGEQYQFQPAFTILQTLCPDTPEQRRDFGLRRLESSHSVRETAAITRTASLLNLAQKLAQQQSRMEQQQLQLGVFGCVSREQTGGLGIPGEQFAGTPQPQQTRSLQRFQTSLFTDTRGVRRKTPQLQFERGVVAMLQQVPRTKLLLISKSAQKLLRFAAKAGQWLRSRSGWRPRGIRPRGRKPMSRKLELQQCAAKSKTDFT